MLYIDAEKINCMQPIAVENLFFIDIPGSIDIAVKGNILYADLYTDLVALDISNPLNVVKTKIDLQTNHTNYQFITLPNDKQHTLLIWNINTTLGWYPWERIQGVIMDKIAGPAYISTLQNLKETVENYVQGSLTK